MTKKNLYLFLGLALPVLIFIFLKFFGKNQFDVPLLHENGVAEIEAGCKLDYPKPYLLPDSVITRWHKGEMPVLLLLNFSRESSILTRIADNFAVDGVTLVNVPESNDPSEDFIRKCLLLIKAPADIVLIDKDRNIRGYYDVEDRDELDRLQAEMTIMLKKY